MTKYKYVDREGREFVSFLDFRETVPVIDKENKEVVRFKYPWVYVQSREPVEVIQDK